MPTYREPSTYLTRTYSNGDWVYHSATYGQKPLQLKAFKHFDLLPGHLAKLTDIVFIRYRQATRNENTTSWNEFWKENKKIFIDIYRLYFAYIGEPGVTAWLTSPANFTGLNNSNSVALIQIFPALENYLIKRILLMY